MENDLTMCNWDLFETILKDHQLDDFLSVIYKNMQNREVDHQSMKLTILDCALTWKVTHPDLQTEVM